MLFARTGWNRGTSRRDGVHMACITSSCRIGIGPARARQRDRQRALLKPPRI